MPRDIETYKLFIFFFVFIIVYNNIVYILYILYISLGKINRELKFI